MVDGGVLAVGGGSVCGDWGWGVPLKWCLLYY